VLNLFGGEKKGERKERKPRYATREGELRWCSIWKDNRHENIFGGGGGPYKLKKGREKGGLNSISFC